jgi:ABC-2 type transport system permease protein
MSKTYIIFKHEFLHEIKRLSFLIMTLIVPVLALLGIGITELVMTMSTPTEKSVRAIGIVDQIGKFDIQSTKGFSNLYPISSKEEATRALIHRKISEYIVIPAEYASNGTVRRYTLEKELSTPPSVVYTVKSFLTANLLKDKVPPATVGLIVSPLKMEVTRLNERGEKATEQSNIGNIIIPAVFSLLLSLALMFGAYSLINGLGEEKESRLIEVMFSSVSVRQLLIGKVLGMGTAGLLQILVWLISAPLLLNLAIASFGGFISNIQIPGNFLVLGIIYFLMGYLLFAVLSIGISAISSNAREGSQLSLFYTLTSLVPVWFISLLMFFPNSPIWVVLTIFPVTAPVQTMLRLGVSDIPLWQIITSIGVLGLSIAGGLYLSIKIFRVHMLMHGKRAGIKEIIYNLKSA